MPSTPKPHTSALPLRLRWYRTLSSSILWDWACPISPGEDTWPGRRRVRIEGCVVINAGCLGCCQGGGKGCRAGPDGWGLKHKLIRHGPWICSTSTLTLITDRNPKMGLCICPNRQNTHTNTYIYTDWLYSSVNVSVPPNFLSCSFLLFFFHSIYFLISYLGLHILSGNNEDRDTSRRCICAVCEPWQCALVSARFSR